MVPRFGGKVLMDKESGREMRGPVFVAWCFPVRLASILLIGSELGNGRMGEWRGTSWNMQSIITGTNTIWIATFTCIINRDVLGRIERV